MKNTVWMIVAMFLCSVAQPAVAADGLVWAWDKPITYEISAQVRLPEALAFNASENIDARMLMFRFDLVTTCSPVRNVGKKKVELRCEMDDVRLLGQAVVQDEGKLGLALKDYDKLLSAAAVELRVTRDGLVKRFDLDGIDRRNGRMVALEENLMIVLARALGGLDLQLPKGGDDKGRVWKQKSVLAMGFPSNQGTMGSASVRHVVTSVEDGSVIITSEGKGLMGSGAMVEVGGKTQPKNMYRMTMSGVARFDTVTGSLIEREYIVEAESTSSGAGADVLSSTPYVQVVRVKRLDTGVTEKFGESGELELPQPLK